MAQHCSRLAFGTPRLDGWLVRAGDRISLTDDLHPIGKRAEIYRDDLDEMKAATAEFIAHHGIDAKGRKVPPAIATTSYTMSTTIFEPSPSSPKIDPCLPLPRACGATGAFAEIRRRGIGTPKRKNRVAYNGYPDIGDFTGELGLEAPNGG